MEVFNQGGIQDETGRLPIFIPSNLPDTADLQPLDSSMILEKGEGLRGWIQATGKDNLTEVEDFIYREWTNDPGGQHMRKNLKEKISSRQHGPLTWMIHGSCGAVQASLLLIRLAGLHQLTPSTCPHYAIVIYKGLSRGYHHLFLLCG